jgi:hypothetical protein
MTDDAFKALCNTYGFAPSRALREMLDKAMEQERERIIAQNAPEIEKVNAHIKALEEAVAAEREACAKVCDEFESEADPDGGFVLAAAIRARSNT